MPVTNLNRTTVTKLALAAGQTETSFWDDTLTGFALRIRVDAAGKARRTFIVQYRFAGKSRKIKLGDACKINVDQARKKAEKLFAQITLGTDPQQVKEAQAIEAARL